MFISYKLASLNYAIMIMLVLMITLFQNISHAIFGFSAPLYLWIPCVIYWGLYRKIMETIFMLYFISLSIASTSSLLAGFLLSFSSLVILGILLFKRIYYTSLTFFSGACALALLFFPGALWVLSHLTDGKTYFHGVIPWLAGAIITWILSFPLLGIFKWIDNMTGAKAMENKTPEIL